MDDAFHKNSLLVFETWSAPGDEAARLRLTGLPAPLSGGLEGGENRRWRWDGSPRTESSAANHDGQPQDGDESDRRAMAAET
jgi:hypothetical protein